jgi:hypothetical protein
LQRIIEKQICKEKGVEPRRHFHTSILVSRYRCRISSNAVPQDSQCSGSQSRLRVRLGTRRSREVDVRSFRPGDHGRNSGLCGHTGPREDSFRAP